MIRISETALLSSGLCASALLAFIVAFSFTTFSGCSSGSAPYYPPNNGPDTNVVVFPRTAVAHFVRDSVEMNGGVEVYTPFVDSIAQTVAADSIPWQGQLNVS